MVEPLVVVGIAVAVFVGFNVGGSSTGVAFGPAVGSRIVGKLTAASLFTVFALAGAWTVGRHVILTMSEGIVPAEQFTPIASVVVLFFTGASLTLSNLYGTPASTSMTAVGAIAGLGLATGTLDTGLMLTIVTAWIVAPFTGLLAGVLVGRYLYPHLDARAAFGRLDDMLVQRDRSDGWQPVRLNPSAGPRDVAGSLLVLAIALYMAFSAGASNAANVVAPLVGNGVVSLEAGILLAVAAIGVGGFTIARRTLSTVGEEITDVPILAALIVSAIGATIITALSRLGVPASLAVTTTSTIIGLGWGRASRALRLRELADPLLDEQPPPLSTGALRQPPAGPEAPRSPTVGELAHREEPDDEPADVRPIGTVDADRMAAESLFNKAAAARIVFLWILTPILSVAGSYLVFTGIA